MYVSKQEKIAHNNETFIRVIYSEYFDLRIKQFSVQFVQPS